MQYRIAIIFISFCVLCLIILPDFAFSEQKFPPPQFKSDYKMPETIVQPPRSDFYEYLDVAVLVLALFLASYLALKKRSRRGIFYLSIFSLLYFGFWRKGCVCSIGSIQNIALALFNNGYTVPITVIAFFTLPLLFTLFFGRTFCAAVCPLGIMQDIVLLKPIKVPKWLGHGLRMFVYIYFALAILLAATASGFIICEYDPFVAFFRRSGSFNILILSMSFLVMSVFVGRPYCRFICPYSLLLGIMSRASKWHVSITPSECIQCRLCEDSCPFDAIQKPNREELTRNRFAGKKILAWFIASLPVLIIIGILLGLFVSKPLSRINPTVSLAQRVYLEETGKEKEMTEASDAFRRTGRSPDELYADAAKINKQFIIGAGIMGGFLGLVFGVKLIQLSVKRVRTDYEADRISCVSCGRCFKYCPVGTKIRQLDEGKP